MISPKKVKKRDKKREKNSWHNNSTGTGTIFQQSR